MKKAMAEWKQIISAILGRKFVSKTSRIVSDIHCVWMGLKPGFLFDYGNVTRTQIRSLLESAYSNGLLVTNTLCVITVDTDIVIINPVCLEQHLYRLEQKNSVSFIDISGRLQAPERIAEESRHKVHPSIVCVRTILQELQRSTQQDAECGVKHESINQDAECGVKHQSVNQSAQQDTECGVKHESINQDAECGVKHQSINQSTQQESNDFIKFSANISPSANVTTVYGLLLGYPIVYWYELDDSHEFGRCLSMEPLRNVKVWGSGFQAGQSNTFSQVSEDRPKGSTACESKGSNSCESKGSNSCESKGSNSCESKGSNSCESKGSNSCEPKGSYSCEANTVCNSRNKQLISSFSFPERFLSELKSDVDIWCSDLISSKSGFEMIHCTEDVTSQSAVLL